MPLGVGDARGRRGGPPRLVRPANSVNRLPRFARTLAANERSLADSKGRTVGPSRGPGAIPAPTPDPNARMPIRRLRTAGSPPSSFGRGGRAVFNTAVPDRLADDGRENPDLLPPSVRAAGACDSRAAVFGTPVLRPAARSARPPVALGSPGPGGRGTFGGLIPRRADTQSGGTGGRRSPARAYRPEGEPRAARRRSPSPTSRLPATGYGNGNGRADVGRSGDPNAGRGATPARGGGPATPDRPVGRSGVRVPTRPRGGSSGGKPQRAKPWSVAASALSPETG